MLGSLEKAISLVLLAGLAVAGLCLVGGDFLVMLPAFALLAPLLRGRYLGERRIERLRRALVARRLRPLAGSPPRAALRARASLSRGGRLIATSLAVRPPPLSI